MSDWKDNPPWECAAVMSDVWNMRLETSLLFEWCPRAANEAANWIAEASHTIALSPNWGFSSANGFKFSFCYCFLFWHFTELKKIKR
ncbi:hypothetical protein RHMOL_Rhmol03G0200900 [Rhododendron molle]|uniref:Uncharacterized protein n=1 Tax=Rhododendron molle TaxID=49168 RepID=A0ACC0PIX9_RHOML|nr:hypothetical protein RHMOL_Rhmol03G0200900 [Rhododendron molle]